MFGVCLKVEINNASADLRLLTSVTDDMFTGSKIQCFCVSTQKWPTVTYASYCWFHRVHHILYRFVLAHVPHWNIQCKPAGASFLKRTTKNGVATSMSKCMVRTNTHMAQFNGYNSHGDYSCVGITAMKKKLNFLRSWPWAVSGQRVVSEFYCSCSCLHNT
jgi:hypothetical protein